tara:strand:+ start:834 stop:1457 length:624 start_codon:yes stop_codon:yes gene_type:complete
MASNNNVNTDDEITEVLKELGNKKMKKENRLSGMRTYLAGPIDHAKDDGVGWRNKLKKFLSNRGVKVLDPCDKPISYSAYKEIGVEKQKMMELKKTGRFFELSEQMKEIAHVDLRMTDVSDCVVVYIDPKTPMFGTIHELINSLQQRKPTLVVVEGGKTQAPNWLFGIMDYNFMFDSFDDLETFLALVDEGAFTPDLTRWVFFDFRN